MSTHSIVALIMLMTSLPAMRAADAELQHDDVGALRGDGRQAALPVGGGRTGTWACSSAATAAARVLVSSSMSSTVFRRRARRGAVAAGASGGSSSGTGATGSAPARTDLAAGPGSRPGPRRRARSSSTTASRDGSTGAGGSRGDAARARRFDRHHRRAVGRTGLAGTRDPLERRAWRQRRVGIERGGRLRAGQERVDVRHPPESMGAAAFPEPRAAGRAGHDTPCSSGMTVHDAAARGHFMETTASSDSPPARRRSTEYSLKPGLDSPGALRRVESWRCDNPWNMRWRAALRGDARRAALPPEGRWALAVGPEVARRTEVLALEGRHAAGPGARRALAQGPAPHAAGDPRRACSARRRPGPVPSGLSGRPVTVTRPPRRPPPRRPCQPAPLPESVAAAAAAIADPEIRERVSWHRRPVLEPLSTSRRTMHHA